VYYFCLGATLYLLAMRFLLLALAALSAVAAGDTEAREMMALHNSLRASVHVPPLEWSDHLASVAEDWAKSLIGHGQFYHSKNKHYGENLAEFRGGKASAKQAFELWAAEAKNYDHKSNHCQGACGHYTQAVWSATRQVGCAVARGAGREVWVCEYSPPGNFVGQRPY
jgi:pathogenesis-related protein 1